MYSCSKSPKGSDSEIEDKIDNLIHKFPDQDSNIWGLALWHLWFHFPNFPVQQLRIAWHVHSEGRGRHRRHRPVVPAKCRHPCGSREQPMHCKCQGVATSQAGSGPKNTQFPQVCTLGNTPMLERLFLCWFSKCAQNSEAHPTCLNVWNMIPPWFFGCYNRDKGDIGHEEVTNLGIRITMFKQGSICYEPKQCTINFGKSLKITIHLHCLIPPPNGWHSITKHGILKMIFLFPRWDMLVPWRVM